MVLTKVSVIDIRPTENTLQRSISIDVQYTMEAGRENVISLVGVLKDQDGIVLTTMTENPNTFDASSRKLSAFEINRDNGKNWKRETVNTELIATLGDPIVNHLANQLLRNEDQVVRLELDVTCRYLKMDLNFYNQRQTILPNIGENTRPATYTDRYRVYGELVPLKINDEENVPQDLLVFSSEQIIDHPFLMEFQRWGKFLFNQDPFNNSDGN